MREKKIGVIGAGVFGSTISVKLAESGFSVILFEKEKDVLLGGTRGSILRLHSGAHYPRHLPTAIQSRKGMHSFIETYSDAVYEEFPNYYAIVREKSKVNRDEYELFLNKAGIKYDEIGFEELAHHGLSVSNLTGIWRIQEGVIDLEKLKDIIRKKIEVNKVILRLDTKVVQVNSYPSGYEILTDPQGEAHFVNQIIVADYGANEFKFGNQLIKSNRNEYQMTAILEFQAMMEAIGITLVDGDFLTVVPKGFKSNSFLAYGPTPSVIKRIVASSKFELDQIPVGDWENGFVSSIMGRIQSCFSNKIVVEKKSVITSFRTIPAMAHDTDRRPTLLERRDSGIYQVVSGKIDHVVDLSDQLIRQLKSKK